MNHELKKKFKAIDERMMLENREGDLSRARSVTVGTCFGGTTEIMMRGNQGYMWAPMQPVEVVELINQLAANIGCDIALKPKNDFASWRNWRVTSEERERLGSHPPFVNDMAPFNQVGVTGLDPGLERALANDGVILEFHGGVGGGKVDGVLNGGDAGVPLKEIIRSKQNVMATEKPKNRRSFKRATKAT